MFLACEYAGPFLEDAEGNLRVGICFTRYAAVVKRLIFRVGMSHKLNSKYSLSPQSLSPKRVVVSIALAVCFCVILIDLGQITFLFKLVSALL